MIYLANISKLNEEALKARVCPERAEYAAKYKNAADRIRSLSVAVLLEEAMKQEYGISGPILLSHTENQKPYIVNCLQLLGRNVEISMTHSGDYVGVAVSEKPIGLDLEQHGKSDRGEKVAKHFFTEAENLRIQQAPDQNSAFYKYWTLRESYLKCIGTGLTLSFDAFSTDDEREGVTYFHRQGDESTCFGTELEAPSGYSLSVCSTDLKLLKNITADGTILVSL